MVDNGNGLSYDDLCLAGGRYMTSKCHTVDDINTHLKYFGYRGEAIASIVDVSGTVELCSRHKLSQNTYSKIFHNGKAMPVTASKSHRPSVGTTVSIHDFFYNMPVRKKGISATFELEQVKRVVESIALINPSVSFSVRNDATGGCVLQTHKTDSVMSRFGLLFGRDKTSALKAVSLSQAGFELSGFMSTDGHHNKSLQFIYVNGRIVKKTPLHSCMNNMLANSLLTRKLSRVIIESNLRKERESGSELLSPRRTSDLFGMYVLHIKCLRSEYDICLEPAKTLIEFKDWDRITSAVEELVQDFILKNNLTLSLMHPAASSSLVEQQEGQLSPSSMINEDRSDVNPHLSTDHVIDDSMLAPSLQSRTVRRLHPLARKRAKEENPYLHQSMLHVPGIGMVESKTVETPGTVGNEDNHTATTDDDLPVQEGLSSSRAIQANLLPPCSCSESGFLVRDGSEQSVTDSRPFNCPPTSMKQYKLPTACIMNYDEVSIYDAKQQAYTMSPANVHANCYQQYPSSLFSDSCIPSDLTYLSCSTSGGQLMDKSHMQNFNNGVNKDSDNNCAPFVSSKDPSNTRGHSPLTCISYRSPLQSSISSKLSELFRSNSKKDELTSISSFLDKRKWNIPYQRPAPASLVTCQSVSLEWKRSDHSKLPHDEAMPSSLISSVASTCTCICTSSYISKSECSCNAVQPILSFAPSVMNSVPTFKHSQMSTASVLEGRPLSLGICDTKPRDSLAITSTCKSATAGCHVLCSTEAATNSCISKSLYEINTSANQTPLLASHASLINRLDSESCVHPDDLAECTSSSKSTTITNQRGVDEDDHSILNTDFTDEIASVTESSAFDRKEQVWKKVTDPSTGRILYMHSKSGNCVSSLPCDSSTSSEVAIIFSKDSRHDPVGHGPLDNVSSINCSSSTDVPSGDLCHDTQFSRDTFHLSHSQKQKFHRFSLNTDGKLISNSDLSISTPLANRQPQMELLGTKWRHQSELNKIFSTHGCGTANCMSFGEIFKGWKNPTFQGGEEVS